MNRDLLMNSRSWAHLAAGLRSRRASRANRPPMVPKTRGAKNGRRSSCSPAATRRRAFSICPGEKTALRRTKTWGVVIR
jgi:hypothetical protein